MAETVVESAADSRWQFWVDRGGTFTDIVARRPDGSHTTHKLLSENPEHYADAALQGIRDLMQISRDAAIPTERIASVKMGTTVGTNALLERKGERTLLVTTSGFRDALRIGYQNRPKLFALNIELPELLYEQVIEVAGRIDAHGNEITPLDVEGARRDLQAAFDDGIRGCAIVFIHGYRHTAHETRIAELAREIGFTQVSTSHETSPLMKLVSRGDTTVVDAYLSPILRRYVDQVAAELGGTRLMFMQSSGGLTDARLFQGRDCILSGPAGGVVGAVRTTSAAGFDKIIGFDMGGTSTDVSHYAGVFERAFETEVAGVRMRAPMMDIHTVAAGGGSILHFDGSRFRVGPDSAGANPGPACYRRGGPLTVTDCNVMLGKLNPDFFPKVFGPNGDEALDAAVVAEKFADLAAEVAQATGETKTVEEIADGFLKIAVQNMANAIKKISIERGYDVTEYVLTCFGGAGGQHACLVADSLGMKQVLIHPYAGVLSAYGMGLADITAMRERAVEAVLDDGLVTELSATLDSLAADGRAEVEGQGVAAEDIDVLRRVHLRYEGSDTALVVPYGALAEIRAAFDAAHRQQFGFTDDSKAHIVEAVSVEVVGGGESIDDALETSRDDAANAEAAPIAQVAAYLDGETRQAPVYDRDRLTSGNRIDGPAVIVESTGTTIVEPGWQAVLTGRGDLVLTRVVALPRRVAVGTDVDPVMLEIFNNLFMSIAEQMGVALENTASSVNIKERLDFSCALFDHDGQLVANAPHIPVHLGSMSESVESIARQRAGEMRPGDVYMLNAPYNGGTHLPDVTVITPVFDETGKELRFFVASRGHHADIGGITPGSMPPWSRTVDEEGVLIDNFQLVDQGRFLEAETMRLLTDCPYPARSPRVNIADFKAQIAANAKGVDELNKMVAHFGIDVVQAYMAYVRDNAEESVRRLLHRLKPGRFAYEMDDGAVIKVEVRLDPENRRATLDFSGTSPQRETNYNAPTAVCMAAILYVLRCLVDDDIPLNAGCLKPIDVILPEGCMLRPQYPAAVVAGNVETSQCITDTLFGAFAAVGAAQGTNNNFTFGNDTYQYYETICGGAGAGDGFNGASAVHTHMTNTRLTDPEVLEWRFPVLLESFAVRHGSGGPGRWHGGDGIVRRVRFLEPMTAAILSSHRRIAPFGLNGGGPGKCGRNAVERADGGVEELSGCDQVEMAAGDTFVIETPGGGGYGEPVGARVAAE